MPDTDSDWRKWGREDPYFGVLTAPQFRRDAIENHRAAFFATGEIFVRHLLAELQLPELRRALDHGCGTGRLTLALADAFEDVVALDVAPAMLAEARANAMEAKRKNLHFAAADDSLSEANGTFDLVVSHLVLQHVPVHRGLSIFDALIDRVAPGGGFAISVSIRNDRGPLRWLYWASATIPGVKGLQNVLRGERWSAPAMQMNHYPLDRLVARLSLRGVLRLTLAVELYHPRFQTVTLMGTLPPE